MKPKASRSKTILTKLVAVVILALLVVAAVKCANGASLANTAWSLLPPVIAIVLALITKEAYSALFIGVLVGSLFTCGFAPVATLDTILNDGLIAAISANAGIFLFLVLLGIIVALVNAAGGSAAQFSRENSFSCIAASTAKVASSRSSSGIVLLTWPETVTA